MADMDGSERSLTAITEHDTPALDVDVILQIHREPGYVSFVRKRDPALPALLDKYGRPKEFENLCSIPVEDLRTMFRPIARWLTHDSYFTVNTYYRAAPYKNAVTGLPDVWRQERCLKWLTACYADIDCGRPDSDDPLQRLTWTQAFGQVEHLMDAGELPQASLMAHSGRGIYLFWLLRDVNDPAKLPRAYPNKITRYKAINRALHDRLRSHLLPADPIFDAARVLRTPGSVHRGAHRRCVYWIRKDVNGRGFDFTLPELSEWVKLPAIEDALPEPVRQLARPATYRISKNYGSAPLRSHGPKALNALRAQDLITIEAWRGGYRKRGEKYDDGSTACSRRFVLSLYAHFLRGAHTPPRQALNALRPMAANCKPAYPSDANDAPVEHIVANEYGSRHHRQWRNVTLCKALGITADIAQDIGLLTILPKQTAITADNARPRHEDIIEDRREYARQYRARNGGHATARGLAAAYKAAGFTIGANHQTANQDLNAIGYCTERTRAGRPRLTMEAK